MEDDLNYKPMSGPRYTGIATFFRAPLVRDPCKLDIALIGVPFDGGVENRPGQRHGPREIRNMSSMIRAVHHVTRVNPYEICRIADERSSDLVVLATHGHGGLEHALLGSTVERVVRKSPCPVLTIRHPEHEFVHS